MIYTEESNVAAEFIAARPFQTEVNSEAAFKQTRRWLEECNNHEHCPKHGDSQLPTRVIEVSPGDRPDKPRLLETRGKSGSYAALSYCWGKNQTGLTTTDSLQRHLTSIDQVEISQTVQDAIACTRSLRIPYLWVDALCISQDSNEDKRKEIANMKNIYRHSAITIVAASSDCASTGFLEDRPPQPQGDELFQVPWPLPNMTFGKVFLDLPPHHWATWGEEPLFSRDWTLQEGFFISSSAGLFI